jgi:hypothetical protein
MHSCTSKHDINLDFLLRRRDFFTLDAYYDPAIDGNPSAPAAAGGSNSSAAAAPTARKVGIGTSSKVWLMGMAS